MHRAQHSPLNRQWETVQCMLAWLCMHCTATPRPCSGAHNLCCGRAHGCWNVEPASGCAPTQLRGTRGPCIPSRPTEAASRHWLTTCPPTFLALASSLQVAHGCRWAAPQATGRRSSGGHRQGKGHLPLLARLAGSRQRLSSCSRLLWSALALLSRSLAAFA